MTSVLFSDLFLFHRLRKGYVSDAAGEEVAARYMACDITAENDGSAKRSLEFVENGWFEDGRLLPIHRECELAILDGKAIGGLEFDASVFAGILSEILRGSLERFIPFKNLRRSVFKIDGEAHSGI